METHKRKILSIVLQQAKKYAAQIRKSYQNIDSIYLFGSSVKGNFKKYSDIDVAVIMKIRETDFFNIESRLMILRRNIDLRIEPHLITLSDFNEGHPLSEEILKNGIKIN